MYKAICSLHITWHVLRCLQSIKKCHSSSSVLLHWKGPKYLLTGKQRKLQTQWKQQHFSTTFSGGGGIVQICNGKHAGQLTITCLIYAHHHKGQKISGIPASNSSRIFLRSLSSNKAGCTQLPTVHDTWNKTQGSCWDHWAIQKLFQHKKKDTLWSNTRSGLHPSSHPFSTSSRSAFGHYMCLSYD